MKKIIAIALFLLLALPAYAAEFAVPTDKNDANVNIGAGQTHKNLYAAAPNLTITGLTKGDLTAAAGVFTLDGEVEKNLLAGGGNMFINGRVGETARIGGGNINVSSQIGGDLLVGGGNVTITEKASVGGDLLVGGGNVIINSPVKGSLRVAGGNVAINSKIEGDVNATVGQKLSFGPSAEVLGKIYYKSPSRAAIDPAAKLGAVNYTPAENRSAGIKAVASIAFAIKLLAWMLAAWLLLYLRSGKILGLFEGVRKTPWANLGIGLLGLIGWPLVTVLVLFTAVGYYVAAFLGLFYVLLLMLSALLSAVFLGQFALSYLNKPHEQSPAWQIAVLGVVLWEILKFVPVLGWLVCAVTYLMVFGALMKAVKENLRVKSN